MRRTTNDDAKALNGDSAREAVEVSEAIKALQSQLADLRKIVQAAKPADTSVIEPARRQ